MQNDHLSIPSQIHAARRLALAGQPREALSILDEFGDLDFATYRLVRGECYYTLREFEHARDEFRNALRLAPNSPRAEILLQLSTEMVQLGLTMRPAQDITSLVATKDKDLVFSPNHLELLAAAIESAMPQAGTLERDSLAEITLPSTDLDSDSMGLVSETLAKIMTEQGKFEEARKVYIQLARLNPARYEYFRERMDELDERIEAGA